MKSLLHLPVMSVKLKSYPERVLIAASHGQQKKSDKAMRDSICSRFEFDGCQLQFAVSELLSPVNKADDEDPSFQ